MIIKPPMALSFVIIGPSIYYDEQSKQILQGAKQMLQRACQLQKMVINIGLI